MTNFKFVRACYFGQNARKTVPGSSRILIISFRGEYFPLKHLNFLRSDKDSPHARSFDRQMPEEACQSPDLSAQGLEIGLNAVKI